MLTHCDLVRPIPSAAQLRRGEVSALAPGTDLTVSWGGVARLNFRAEANCQLGPARGTASIRSRFADALLLCDKGEGFCEFPRWSTARVVLGLHRRVPRAAGPARSQDRTPLVGAQPHQTGAVGPDDGDVRAAHHGRSLQRNGSHAVRATARRDLQANGVQGATRRTQARADRRGVYNDDIEFVVDVTDRFCVEFREWAGGFARRLRGNLLHAGPPRQSGLYSNEAWAGLTDAASQVCISSNDGRRPACAPTSLMRRSLVHGAVVDACRWPLRPGP